MHTPLLCGVRGNTILVSVSVCQAGRPGSNPARSACFGKVRFFQQVIDLFPRLVHQRLFMCYHVCVIMHVKDPYVYFVRVGHRVPLAGFCLSIYGLHVCLCVTEILLWYECTHSGITKITYTKYAVEFTYSLYLKS